MLQIADYISATVQNTPGMTNGLPGGFWFLHAPSDKVRPYCVAHLLHATDEYDTGDAVQHKTPVQFNFYCDQIANVRSTIRAFKRAFLWQPATLSDGSIYGARLNNEFTDFESGGSDDDELLDAAKYVLEIEFWSETTQELL